MIRELISNLRNSNHLKGTWSEKISTFFTLTRLQIKSKIL